MGNKIGTPVSLNPVTVEDKPSTVIGTPVKISNPTGGQSFMQGFMSASPRNFDISSYQKMMNNVDTNLPLNILNEERARYQSTGHLIGNSLIQLGGTIIGDIISGVGALFNFNKVGIEFIKDIVDTNYQPDWTTIMNKGVSGAIQDFGKSISEGSREIAPIYLTERAQRGGLAGGMGDKTWWAANFPTIGSAAASMIPIMGQMRALNYIGKSLSKVGNVSKIGRGINTLGRTITNNKVQATIGTLYGAHLDIMQEIVYDYDNQFQYAKNLGYSDEEAREFASIYASTAYKDAWAYGILFNAIELNSILKGTNRFSKTISEVDKTINKHIPDISRQGTKFTGISEEVVDLSKKTIFRATLGKSYDFFKTSISEGLEEMRTDIALKEGELEAKKYLDIYDPLNDMTFAKRLYSQVSDARNWDSFLWGMAGGAVMYAGKGILNKIRMPDSYKDYNKKLYEGIMNSLQDTINTIATFDGDLSIRTSLEEDPAITILAPLFNTLGAANAIVYGERLLDELGTMTSEELTAVYGSDKTELINTLREEFKIAKDIYVRNADITYNSKADDYIQNEMAGLEYLHNYYTRKFNEIETEIQRIKTLNDDLDIKRDNELKELDGRLYKLNSDKESLLNSIKFNEANSNAIDKFVNSKETSEKLNDLKREKESLEKEIKSIKQTIKSNNTRNDNIRRNLDRLNSLLLNAETDTEKEQYKTELKHNKNKLINNSKNIDNLYIKEQALSGIKTSIAYLNGEIESQLKRKEFNTKAIERAKSTIDMIDAQIDKYKESRGDIIKRYEEIRKDYDSIPRVKNITLEDLTKLRDNIFKQLSNYGNIQDHKEEFANNLKTAVESIIDIETKELERKEYKIEEDKKNTESEIKEEDEFNNRPTSIKTVLNEGEYITLTIDDSNKIRSFIIKGKKYDLNKTYNIRGKDVEIINIKDDNGTIKVTTPEGDILAVVFNMLSSRDSSGYSKTIYSVIDKFTKSRFENDFYDTLVDLDKTLKDTKFKKAFTFKVSNIDIISLRGRTIEGIINNLTKYAKDKVNENNQELYNKVYNELNSIYAQSVYDGEILLIKDYLYDRFYINLSAKSAEINNQFNSEYLDKFIDDLAKYIERNVSIDFANDRFKFKYNVDINEFINTLQTYFDEFESLLTNKFYTQYTLQDFSDLNDELANKFNTFKEQLLKDYNKQQEVRKTELDKIRAELDTEESANKDFLNAIIDFISFSESTDSNIEDRENISKNDYRYYVTPDRLNAYITLANVISKWKVSNSFNPNRKLSYTDILSIIYNTPEGIEKIDDIYKSLWRALKAASDIDSIESLKDEIKENVPKENYKEFFNILDTIVNNIVPPIRSIESKYLDKFDNITSAYIKDFKKTHFPERIEYGTHEGVPLSNNIIFDSLKSAMDSKSNKIEHLIKIEDKTYSPTELINIYKNITNGTPIAAKYDIESNIVTLTVTINGNTVPIGSIGLSDHLKIGNLKAYKELKNSGGTLIYDSFLGTSDGLKSTLISLLQTVSKSPTAYDLIREYFKTYLNAKTNNTTTDSLTIDTLKDIISKLDKIGTHKNAGGHSNIVNALIQLSNYNTEREDTDEINYEDLFTVIQPIFYGRLNIIDSLNNNYYDLKNSYETFNSRVGERFNQLETIRKAIIDNPDTPLVITHVGKPRINYSNDRRIKNNINDSIQKDVEVNGKLAVDIISRQLTNNRYIVSSLTRNEIVSDDAAKRTIYDPNRGFDFYAKIKSNGTDTGFSYVPIKLTTVNSDSAYSRVSKEFIEDAIRQIITDRFLTNLSTRQSKDNVIVSDLVKKEYNKKYLNLIDDISEAIIVNNGEKSKFPWFDTSTLYDNKKEGFVSKDIKFIINKDDEHSYAVSLRINYEHDIDVDSPSIIKNIKLTVYDSRENRIKGTPKDIFTQTELSKYGFAKRDSKINKSDVITYSKSNKSKTITFDVNNDNIENFIKSGLIDMLVGNMVRNVKTVLTNGSYTYTSKATGASFGKSYNEIDKNNIIKGDNNSKVFKGTYTSPILEWGKEKGIYSGKTTFDSIQDFYLDTKALVTNIIPIRDNVTNEVVTDYNLFNDLPRIYVKIDNPNAEIEQTKPIETIKEEELSKSVNIIENIASANVYSEDNFIDKLNNEYGLTKDTFINIGFIKRNTTDEVFNIIKDFIVETVDSGKPFPLIIVHNAEDYIRILRSQGYIDASDDELTKNYNMMGASYSGYTSTPFILVNPKIFNTTKRNIGSGIFHEIIHHRVEKDTENDVITDDVKEALNDIVKDLVERKEEVLRYDIEDSIKNSISKSLKVACYNSDGTINEDVAYHELLAYTLSNPNLAGYLNNIYYKEETNRPSESIWKRIIDNLLKLFGIKVNNNSVLQQIQNAFDEGFMFIVDAVEVENDENVTSEQTSERPPALVANKQASIDDIDVTTLSDEEFMNNGDELFLRIDFAISDETTNEISDETTNEISDETTNEAIEPKDDTSILATRAGGRSAVLPTNSINSSDNRNKLLSLNTDTDIIDSFKSSFTDSSNLKIC
jgi:hypothetical protein